MKYSGSVVAPIQGAFIYFIFSHDLLYIGQTQTHPVQRWNSHLFTDNGFRQKLSEHGDPQINYWSDLRLFAYFCQPITEHFPQVQWKMVTQAVEHEMHCCILQYPSKLGSQFTLVSDTKSTAPSRFKHWDFAKEVAMNIHDDLAQKYCDFT